MATITFLPSSSKVVGEIDDSLLDVALDNDIEIDRNCGGVCACTTCAVEVLSGIELLSAMSAQEGERLAENDRLLINYRLACQARILNDGEIVIRPINS